MNSELMRIKELFDSFQIVLSNVWLENCVNWCKTDILPLNYTFQQLQEKIYEQWLLLDLRYVKIAVLPENLSSKINVTLNGNFCLQLMQIVDISKPKLWQLQKIQNSNSLTRMIQKDADIVGTGKRVLQLTLSDGVQEIIAVEFHPIRCLNLNLAPGIKIRIYGPASIRRGRLMLEERNIKVLGGDVEDLAVSNAPENVLARSLNLPLNPNPMNISNDLFVVETQDQNEGYRSTARVMTNIPVPQQQPHFQNIHQKEPMKNIFDDGLEEEDLLLLLESQISENRCLNQNQSNTNTVPTQPIVVASPPKQSTSTFDHDINELNDDFFDDADFGLNEKKEIIKPVLAIPEVKIMSIAKLIEMKSYVHTGIFQIKAKFMQVVEKLSITEEFTLVIKIKDESGDIDVRVHNDIIVDWAGLSAPDILKLKSKIITSNDSATQKIMEILTKVKDRVMRLDNVISIQVQRNAVPVLIKIL